MKRPRKTAPVAGSLISSSCSRSGKHYGTLRSRFLHRGKKTSNSNQRLTPFSPRSRTRSSPLPQSPTKTKVASLPLWARCVTL